MVFFPQEERLFEWRGSGWNLYTMESGRRQRTNKRFIFSGCIAEPLMTLCHATVFSLDPDRYVLSNFGLEAPTLPVYCPSTLEEYIKALPTSLRWAVRRFDSTDNGEGVAHALRMGTAVALSDGSFKDQFRTAAIVIEAANSQHNIIAVNVAPGPPDTQSPFCSELAGLFGQVVLVNTIYMAHNVTSGSIESGCNGKVALEQIYPIDEQVDTSGQQFDLISAIRSALRQSPVTWSFRHVKGHQDEDLKVKLDQWARLNIQMDHLAKAYWAEQYPLTRPDSVPITGAFWSTSIRGRQVTSALRTTMYEEISREKMGVHWEKHDRMNQEHSMLVNWEACAIAMKRLKISR
jgi:hypothetical protein